MLAIPRLPSYKPYKPSFSSSTKAALAASPSPQLKYDLTLDDLTIQHRGRDARATLRGITRQRACMRELSELRNMRLQRSQLLKGSAITVNPSLVNRFRSFIEPGSRTGGRSGHVVLDAASLLPILGGSGVSRVFTSVYNRLTGKNVLPGFFQHNRVLHQHIDQNLAPEKTREILDHVRRQMGDEAFNLAFNPHVSKDDPRRQRADMAYMQLQEPFAAKYPEDANLMLGWIGRHIPENTDGVGNEGIIGIQEVKHPSVPIVLLAPPGEYFSGKPLARVLLAHNTTYAHGNPVIDTSTFRNSKATLPERDCLRQSEKHDRRARRLEQQDAAMLAVLEDVLSPEVASSVSQNWPIMPRGSKNDCALVWDV